MMLGTHTHLHEEFWKLADTTRTQMEYLVDEKLRYLQHAPMDVLHKIFIQYRYFTIYYISDLALLVYRLPFGKLRSLLADFLNDELGNGKAEHAHERLYDKFLLSIGVRQEDLAKSANQSNMALLQEIRELMTSHSPLYAIGLRGMGGECLCQLYLAAMHEHFTKNPAIQCMKEKIAWEFWDIHTGEVDITHRNLLRAAIGELVTEDPTVLEDLVLGYRKSKTLFDQFWTNIYQAAHARVEVAEAL